MTAQAMLEGLEAAASALDVKITYESISASVGVGGLCRVKGQYRIILDKRTSIDERVAAVAAALGRFGWDRIDGKIAANDAVAAPVRDLLKLHSVRRAS